MEHITCEVKYQHFTDPIRYALALALAALFRTLWPPAMLAGPRPLYFTAGVSILTIFND